MNIVAHGLPSIADIFVMFQKTVSFSQIFGKDYTQMSVLLQQVIGLVPGAIFSLYIM
jgi:hypothetical protein